MDPKREKNICLKDVLSLVRIIMDPELEKVICLKDGLSLVRMIMKADIRIGKKNRPKTIDGISTELS